MGYESKLYIVEKSIGKPNEDGYIWAEVIAVFDLCVANLNVKNYPPTDCYIYDGNDTPIYEDMYGEPLREISITDMIEIIEKARENDTSYRRYQPCLQLLKGFDESQWRKIVVLHYGY